MSIPGSLLSALLPNTLPAAQATARSLAQRAAQAFGELVHPQSPSSSGPSEAISTPPQQGLDLPATPKGSSASERITARLTEWLRTVANRLGWNGSNQKITVVSDGVGVPKIESAPAALAGPLQESLSQQTELIQAINEATRERLESDPLQWMPGHEPEVRWTIPQ